MPSIFSKIIKGDIPCYKIIENENFIAFLDVFPLKKGHTLVVPKKEIDYIFDLDSDAYNGLMDFSRIVAQALKKAIPCKRVGIAVIGLEVPHAHVHLVPINSADDINFNNSKLELSKHEFEEIASKIKAFL